MAGREMNSGPTAATVRANLAHYRKDAEMTYAELARSLEARGHPIPPLGLRRIEAGERRVDVDDLVALALALDVTPNALLLPRTESIEDPAKVTGYSRRIPLSTHMAWAWARGAASISADPKLVTAKRPDGTEMTVVDNSTFRQRVTPRRILTTDERIERRRAWITGQIYELEDEMRLDRSVHGAPIYDGREDEVNALRALDPADDAAWAAVDFDPAPPAAEVADRA